MEDRTLELWGNSIWRSWQSQVGGHSMRQIPCGLGYCFINRANASNAWKNIMKNVAVLHKGMHKAVTNGETTKFWFHCWAGPNPLLDLIVQGDSISPLILVSSGCLGCKRGGWKGRQFKEFLLDDVVMRMNYQQQVTRTGFSGVVTTWGCSTIASTLKLIRYEQDLISSNNT